MYRILWTRPDVEGGWYNDVDAADEASAAWQVATNAGPDQSGRMPQLVAVSNLDPPQAQPQGDGG